eukprot:c30240_g1_i1 orf=216-371(-)
MGGSGDCLRRILHLFSSLRLYLGLSRGGMPQGTSMGLSICSLQSADLLASV